MSEIKESLRAYGLEENEVSLYLFLLENQDRPAYFISKETSIPRTTVYKTLERMCLLGFVSSWTKNGTKFFSAENPNNLLRNIREKTNKLEQVMPELNDMFRSLVKHPSAKLYSGKEGVKQAFEIMLDVIKTKRLKQIYVYSDSLLTKELPRFFKDWRARKNKTDAYTYLIVPHGTKMTPEYQSDKYRETRVLPQGFPFIGSVDICGPVVAFFSFKDKELHAVVIESEIIASMMTQFFMYTWRTIGLYK